MTVQRWRFVDPDTTRLDPERFRFYTFPNNPREMTSLHMDLSITARTTTAGDRPLVYEGARRPKEWQFSGDIFTAEQYDKMRYWLLEKRKRLFLFDHYGRRITFYPVSFDARPKRNIKRYWHHEYTASGLVLAVAAPTITRDYYT